jgi:hypothetical protein
MTLINMVMKSAGIGNVCDDGFTAWAKSTGIVVSRQERGTHRVIDNDGKVIGYSRLPLTAMMDIYELAEGKKYVENVR